MNCGVHSQVLSNTSTVQSVYGQQDHFRKYFAINLDRQQNLLTLATKKNKLAGVENCYSLKADIIGFGSEMLVGY